MRRDAKRTATKWASQRTSEMEKAKRLHIDSSSDAIALILWTCLCCKHFLANNHQYLLMWFTFSCFMCAVRFVFQFVFSFSFRWLPFDCVACMVRVDHNCELNMLLKRFVCRWNVAGVHGNDHCKSGWPPAPHWYHGCGQRERKCKGIIECLYCAFEMVIVSVVMLVANSNANFTPLLYSMEMDLLLSACYTHLIPLPPNRNANQFLCGLRMRWIEAIFIQSTFVSCTWCGGMQ